MWNTSTFVHLLQLVSDSPACDEEYSRAVPICRHHIDAATQKQALGVLEVTDGSLFTMLDILLDVF